MQLLDKIRNLILTFEKEQPVSSWKYGQMDVWPVFRALVYVECRNNLLSASNGVEFDWKKNKPKNTFLLAGQKVKNLIVKFLGLIIPREKKKLLLPYEKEKTVEFMFFSSWYFRTNYNGRFINRFFEPLREYLNSLHSPSIVVEYSLNPKYSEEYESIRKDTLFLDDYSIGSAEELLDYDLMKNDLFRLFFDSLASLGYTAPLKKLISDKINRVYRESFFYEQLFRSFKPTFAICQTFFNEPMFAMLFAAQKTGVVSVDLGHGFPCGADNIIYTKLENFPDKGYNTLPDLFWVWGDPVKNAMDYWVQKQSKHQVLVGGNPWLDYSRKGLNKVRLSSKKVVLYTLSINLPEQFILESMKSTTETHEWWIRLHPSILSSKSQLEEVLQDNAVFNYNLDDANSQNLPFLLLNCDAHISRNSSSIYESVVFGNHPIILDLEGVHYYQFYLDNNQAFSMLNNSSDELVQLLDFVMREEKGQEAKVASYKETLDLLINNQSQLRTTASFLNE